jgi:hypothetical protein
MVMTSVPGVGPTPAAAQTFSFGGFRIHVSGLGGGGYYRHHSSRHHASNSNSSRRHGRHHRGGDREEETARATPAPRLPEAAPVAATPVVEIPTSTSRPVLHGPDIEPSK